MFNISFSQVHGYDFEYVYLTNVVSFRSNRTKLTTHELTSNGVVERYYFPLQGQYTVRSYK